MKKHKYLLPILAFGVILRLILMPITFHPDLLGHASAAYFFAYQGKFNIYEHLLSLPQDHPLVKNIGVGDIFIYPPLAYFSMGIFRFLIKPFSDPNFVPLLWQGVSALYTYPGRFWEIFLTKLPYLFFDVGLAFLLTGFFDEEKKKKQIFSLWMFNPLTLYATFMIGQLDILPTFFVVLSLLFLRKGKENWSLLALGIGASYKMFPLFLVIPLAFILGNSFKEKLKKLLIGLSLFLLFSLPFLASSAYRQMVLFSPKSQKMLFMNWPVSGAEGLYPFILVFAVICLFSYFKAKRENILSIYLSILLLIFSVTHYHPQWFLWVTPLLLLQLVKDGFRYWEIVLVFFLSWLFIILMFEASLTYGLFSPIWPKLSEGASLATFLGKYTDVFMLKSIVRSIFAGASIFYSYHILKESR